tara:strand:- start:27 stop:230 length:204 start_codon:yes stop_codon:yes gene_type:complete
MTGKKAFTMCAICFILACVISLTGCKEKRFLEGNAKFRLIRSKGYNPPEEIKGQVFEPPVIDFGEAA